MDDFFKNLFKGLFYIGVPIGLGLVSNYITNKREQEVLELKVHSEVERQLQNLLQLPKGS